MVVREDPNNDIAQRIDGTLNLNQSGPLSARLTFGDSNKQVQYPEVQTVAGSAPVDVVETRTENDDQLRLATKYKRSENLSFDFDFGRNVSARDYIFSPQRQSTITRTDAKAAVAYSGWTGGKTNASLNRDRAYEQYPNNQLVQEKTIRHGALTLSHKQQLTKRFSTEVSGKLDLISYAFFRGAPGTLPDSIAPSGDRDLLSRSAEWSGGYNAPGGFNARFALGTKQDETVNIQAATATGAPGPAADNNTKESYWARPSIQIRPVGRATLNQTYEVRVDYTFPEDKSRQNILSRKTELDTGFSYALTKKLNVEIRHFYQVRDDGSYDRFKDSFSRSVQRSKQSLRIVTGYAPLDWLRFSVTQQLEANRAYDFKEVEEDGLTHVKKVKRPGVQGDDERMQFSWEGSCERQITSRLKVSVRARETRTAAANDKVTVSDRERRYHRVEAVLGYTL
jgi:hypothetical protein